MAAGSAQGAGHSEGSTMGNPVTHFEVQAKDAAKQQEFYRSLFGWEVDANNPINYGMVMTGTDRGINGGIGDGQGHARLTFYVEVPDLAAALADAESKGGKTVMGPQDVPGGPTIAMFEDPEGNIVGLMKAG
jgi:uncharacterized protein